MGLRVEYTMRELDPGIPTALRESLEPYFGEATEGKIGLFSVEPPTWVAIVADLLTWKAALGVPVTAFVTRLAQRAADAVWDRKQAIASALKDRACDALLAVATAIREAQQAGGDNFHVVLRISVPDGFYGTAISLRPENVEDAAWYLACFVQKADAIHAFVEANIPTARVLGPVGLTLLEDGSFRLGWTFVNTSTHEYSSHETVI